MMIRTRLKLLAAGDIFLLLLICLISWWGYQTMQTKQWDSDTIEQLKVGASNLNIITLDLLRNSHAHLQLNQWNNIYTQLGILISNTKSRDQTTYPFLKESHKKIGQRFDTYMQTFMTCQQTPDESSSSKLCYKLQDRLRTQVRISLHDLIIETRKSGERITAQLRHQYFIGSGLLLALLLIMSLFTVVVVLSMTRSLGTGLTRMLDASHRFSQGDYDIRLEVNSQDEMDTLASAFNTMVEQRKRAIAELQESDGRWQFALQGSRDGVWDWNTVTNKVFFSRRWKEMLGYTEDEISNGLDEWDKRVHPEDKGRCYTDLERHFSGETSFYENEHRLLCKDGSYKWILDRGKVISWTEDNKPLRVIGTHTDITERKQTENALAISEEIFRNLVESSQDWVWEVDTQGVYTYASPRCRELLGYEPKEIVGRTPFDLMTEPEVKRVQAEFKRITVAAEPIIALENINLHKDGREVVLETSGVPFFDDQGKLAGYRGMDRDITGRRDTENALRKSEEMYRLLFDEADVLVSVYDRNGVCQLMNRKLASFFGGEPNDFIGKSFTHLHPRVGTEYTRRVREVIDNETSREYIDEVVFPKDTRWLLSKTHLVKDARGTKYAAQVTSQDITELVQTEKALRESEARYRAVFNQQFQFMLILSPDGTTLDINELPLRTTDCQQDDFVGKPIWRSPFWKDLPEWQEIWQKRLAHAANTDGPILTEDIYKTMEGTIRNADAATTAIRSDKGHIIFFLVQASDSTQRHHAEQERSELLRDIQKLNVGLEQRVEERTAELEVTNKELQSFAYSVSHDLRAPLRAIDGFSLALKEDYGDRFDETALDYLQRVRNGAQRMGMLIDDLLQLSRVSRGELKLEKVDMGAIAKAVQEEIKASEPDRQVDFTLDENMQVMADARLLRVMLDNLLGNAWKFTRQEVKPQITFKRLADKPEVFFISDNGVGFDMRFADKLFGAFQRLHRTNEFPGTGVGLATVQRIVHRHGGRIWAEAVEGSGATFFFSLGHTKIQIL